jgi:hypothetical protein
MGLFSSVGRHIRERLSPRTIASEIIDTTVAKTAQGAAELSSGLFSQSNAYAPYAADMAQRGQYAKRDQSRVMEP